LNFELLKSVWATARRENAAMVGGGYKFVEEWEAAEWDPPKPGNLKESYDDGLS
jgi:hypothetical protein